MRRAGAVVLSALLAATLSAVPPAATAATGYTLDSIVTYTADPPSGWVDVEVIVTFKNTTPNPSGQTSAFNTIDLPVQAGASAATARDAAGALGARLGQRGDVTVATVTPRAAVLFNQRITFTLTYRLVDGAAPGIHVRSEVVAFPAWGFGTASDVTIVIPVGFDVSSDGDPLTAVSAGGRVTLTSGPIGDPTHWLALVSAERHPSFVTLSRTVTLASATVGIQIRSWTTDETWGDHVAVIVASALPRLEQAAGLPYPRVGSLVVVESVPSLGGGDEPRASGAEIQVAFSASDFTLIHQLAHVWAGEQLSGQRWIREGLASYLANAVAAEMGVSPPYVPSSRSNELAADAIPLDEWGGSTPSAAEAYAYAASWALFERIAVTIGPQRLIAALARSVAGLSAYDPADPPVPPTPDGVGSPLDSRRFLDQLAAVRGIDLTDAFAELVFPANTAPELAQRTAARTAYTHLLVRAGDWGTPVFIQSAMADWNFADATAAIAVAESWLSERDDLFAAADAAELSVPVRLRQQYAEQGGSQGAQDELDAERAVLDAYVAAQHRVAAPRSLIEQIGLAGGSDGRELLAQAKVSFADGDLRSASDLIAALERRLDQAKIDGPLRIGVAGALLIIGGLLIVVGRARRRHRYTPSA